MHHYSWLDTRESSKKQTTEKKRDGLLENTHSQRETVQCPEERQNVAGLIARQSQTMNNKCSQKWAMPGISAYQRVIRVRLLI